MSNGDFQHRKEKEQMLGTIIASFIGGLLAIGVVIWFFKNKGTSGRKEDETVKDAVNPSVKTKENLSKDVYDSLLQVNIFIRTKGLPGEVIALVEKMIDNLKQATPQMIEKHPDHDLTYELKEICKKHLFSQLKEFFDMSLENRNKYMDNLMERLNEIADLIERAGKIVENDEVTEMKMIAGFLETKYSRPLDA
jgi:methyl-accepting chemotaxis protein